MTEVRDRAAGDLPRCSPCDAEVDGSALRAGVDALVADGFELHSVMVARAGCVVAEKWWWPAAPARRHSLHSATKSFVAAAVGIAVGEGAIDLRTRVVDVLADRAPAEVGDNLALLTVADLLTMRGGNAAGISGATSRKEAGSLVRAFLAEPVVHRPGTVFTYSSASSHLLSALVQAATGERVADYLRPRLFEPLGITSAAWDVDPEGVSTGGNGLRITSEELLRFGLLHLDDGVWNGRRILPPGWVAEATRRHVADAHPGVWNGERLVRAAAEEPDERSGYGYQFWVEPDGSYSAQGVFGQLCLVDPASDAVVVTTAGVDSRRTGFHDAVRARLLPVLRAGRCADRDVVRRAPVDGTYLAASNDQGVRALILRTSPDGVDVVVDHERGRQEVRSSWAGWHEGRTSVYGEDLHHSYRFTDEPVVAHARWTEPDVLELDWWFPETAFRDTVVIRFADDGLALDRRTNANSGPLSLPTVVARRQPRAG